MPDPHPTRRGPTSESDPRRDSPVVVVLADGSRTDISGLSNDDLDALQWDQERAFAGMIRRSRAGSDERARVTRDGYDTICTILGVRRAASGDGLRMGYTPRYARLVLEILRSRREPGTAGPRLFEIGFGSGVLLAEVASQGFDVAGIEVSPRIRAQALARVPESTHARLFLGEFLSHPLDGADSAYDVVYWNDVLEHVHPDECLEYLRRACRLLRPGGALVTLTPNWHVRPSDVTARYAPARTEAQGFHLKEYTLRELDGLLRDAGFARVATPLFVTRRRAVLLGDGLRALKCGAEPVLERLPFAITKLICRGMGLNCTIAWKQE